MKIQFAFLLLITFGYSKAQQLTIKNENLSRTLSFDGKVWRTVKFTTSKGGQTLLLKSEEFNILALDSKQSITLSDFETIDQPRLYDVGDTNFLSINYKPLAGAAGKSAMPQRVQINYFSVKGQDFIHKMIKLHYNRPATVDRLEVERFVISKTAKGGGRGEPVFIDNFWFAGLEYPASYSRHTDGNTPLSYGRYYDKVGNYSFIDLDGRDVEPKPEAGLLRLMHFPGYALPTTDGYEITSKKAVFGFAQTGQSIEKAFMNYLSTIWKSPRAFLHYNNWFDPKAKDLKGEGFINVYRTYKAAIDPYGIELGAMVPDNGWQNREGIWEPSPRHFPNGDADLVALSDKLKSEGVKLGLWLSLNSYANDINWGLKNGYKEAKPNSYFKQYGRYYSMSDTKYKAAMLKRMPELAQKADIVYFKHDFNEFCDMGDSSNHPPTDRHGHEANVDAALEILLATKKAKPEVYQNLTNWIWFSPWWLQYADYLWMLAGDDGINGNTPEISTKAMASTDRDTYIWRMWGNPADRPLIPVSRLMTHGIIKTISGTMESKEDNLQDWLEYVLMHYGRGTLLKEWYITAETMSPDYWKALCTVHNWATEHLSELTNTVFVGGRPDEGNAYGYIGWQNNKGILVARNTNAVTQKLVIPFNQSTNFYGAKGEAYKASVVYPYVDQYPQTFISGKDIEITIPGYSTMTLEFEKGQVSAKGYVAVKINFKTNKNKNGTLKTTITVPANAKGRCDLVLTGYPVLPGVTIDGKEMKASRTAKASINNFAGYAVEGMPSKKARDWKMSTIDLLPYAGSTIEIVYAGAEGFESHLLVEQKVGAKNFVQKNNNLWAITNDTRRQTVRLY